MTTQPARHALADAAESSSTVLVIMDPRYGEKLRDVWPGRPVWIVQSPVNMPVVRALWARARETDPQTCITGMTCDPEEDPERSLMDWLGVVDCHHDIASTPAPYTCLTVAGATLTKNVQAALEVLGFAEFVGTADGFVARRSEEEEAQRGLTSAALGSLADKSRKSLGAAMDVRRHRSRSGCGPRSGSAWGAAMCKAIAASACLVVVVMLPSCAFSATSMSVASPAISADGCRVQLPKTLASSVESFFPGYRAPMEQDNQPDDVADAPKSGRSVCLGVSAGNF